MDDDATMPRWGVVPGRLFRALTIAVPAVIVRSRRPPSFGSFRARTYATGAGRTLLHGDAGSKQLGGLPAQAGPTWDGVWRHVTMIYPVTGGLIFYVDGAPEPNPTGSCEMLEDGFRSSSQARVVVVDTRIGRCQATDRFRLERSGH